MEFGAILNNLSLINLVVLIGFVLYLCEKATKHAAVRLLLVAFVPLIIFQLGCYFFSRSPTLPVSSMLIVLGAGLIPLGLTPLSQTLGRTQNKSLGPIWLLYYILQLIALGILANGLYTGRLIEWVTGILDQPIILIDKVHRFWFLNILVSCAVILFCLQNTLRNATRAQTDRLKFILVSFVGFVVYFFYLSAQVVISSYISHSMLLSGAAIVLLGALLLSYSFVKYPFWDIKIHVSRRVMFGSLSLSAALLYIVISGNIIDLVRWLRPQSFDVLLPVTVFGLIASFLLIYLSPAVRARVVSFITNNFFRDKYDYRDLWMKFAEQSSGSVTLADLLPRIGEFIVDCMFVKQVAIWLRSPNSDTFALAYSHEPDFPNNGQPPVLRLRQDWSAGPNNKIFTIKEDGGIASHQYPFEDISVLKSATVERFVLVQKAGETIGVLGIGADIANNAPTREDDQLILSMSSQLAHVILNQKLSEELLLAREWESFNRFSSFVVHDLKNLATMQSMTVENAKALKNNPEFIADAFATFSQTTDKMINLIASLSVQRGQGSLKQQPINILDVLSHTLEDLRVAQRNGVRLVTEFPPDENPPMISGDPELLRKAFTNILLNAIQSLPRGEGSVEVKVTHPNNGKITAAIKDTGCGIPPERLQNLFRPFQTTKKQGTGIGLCHTRSIVEVHGGHIRIESQVNAGTKVELDFPTL